MADGQPIVGTDGQVTWTNLNNQTDHIEAWTATMEKNEVEITDFQTTGWGDYTNGIKRISGTITVNARDGVTPLFAETTVAVLTLDTASTGACIRRTGSAILTRIDFGRTYGDTPEQETYAFRGVRAWTPSRIVL